MEYMVRIINHGKIVGILSPFSYVGAYPFSEPYGVPVFSAAALLVSGINIEWFTLFYGNYILLLALFSILILSRKIFHNNLFALATLLAYSSSLYFVDWTYWNMSNRSMFFGLIPMYFTIFLIIFNSKFNYKFLTLFFLLSFTIYACHRSSVYLGFTTFLLIISMFFSNYFARQRKVRYAMFISTIFVLLFLLYSPDGKYVTSLWHREKFQTPFISPILNLLYTYAVQVSLSVFSIFTVYIILKTKYLKMEKNFMYSLIIITIPLSIDYEYYFPIILTPLSIISGYGIYQFLEYFKDNKSRMLPFFVAFIIIYSSGTTFYLKELNSNINGTNKNIENVEGFGLSGETRNSEIWFQKFIGEDVVLDNTARTNYFINTEVNTLFDRDLIANNDNIRDALEIEPYNLFFVLVHLKPDEVGSYHDGGFVEDWSNIQDAPISQDYHFRLIVMNEGSFLLSIYQPVYAIDLLRDHVPGKYENGKYTNQTIYYKYYNIIFEENYRTYANEQWEFYFLKYNY